MHFFRSLIAFDNHDPESIGSEIKLFSERIETAKLLVTSSGIAVCSVGPTRYAPTEESVKKANVVVHQMKALQALASGSMTKNLAIQKLSSFRPMLNLS